MKAKYLEIEKLFNIPSNVKIYRGFVSEGRDFGWYFYLIDKEKQGNTPFLKVIRKKGKGFIGAVHIPDEDYAFIYEGFLTKHFNKI